MNQELQNQEKGICLIYLRVSTDGQAEKGIAIPTQQDKCIEAARQYGYTFNPETDIYKDEGETGRNMDRAGLLDMLERCKKDKSVKAVIVYDVSRLARDRDDFSSIKVILKKQKIDLVSATEGINSSAEGQMLEGMLSSIAEFQSLQHGRRVRLNMLTKLRDGLWPTRAPYGYVNKQEKISTNKTRAWIEVNWAEAKWVQRAYELFATGNYSLRSLAATLQAEGLPLRRYSNRRDTDNEIKLKFIEEILKNKFYIGVVAWGGVVNNGGKHELFLEKALFDQVQAVLDAHNAGASRFRRLFSVLKSISYCDECGSKMTAEEKVRAKKTLRYLRCLKAQHNTPVPCQQKYTQEHLFMEQFQELLKKIQLPESAANKLRERLRVLFGDEQSIYEKARKDILGQIENIKHKKKNLVLQLIGADQTKSADVELFQSVKTDLEADERRLNNDLANAESKITGVVRTIEIAISLTVNCQYMFINAKEPELQALLARTFFKELRMKDGAIVKAVLNEPLDYICRSKVQNHPVFNYELLGGPGGNRTPD